MKDLRFKSYAYSTDSKGPERVLATKAKFRNQAPHEDRDENLLKVRSIPESGT